MFEAGQGYVPESNPNMHDHANRSAPESTMATTRTSRLQRARLHAQDSDIRVLRLSESNGPCGALVLLKLKKTGATKPEK